jgi:hypothetical protein
MAINFRFVNLTPHAIKLGIAQPEGEGECVFDNIPTSGAVARVATAPGNLVFHAGVEVHSAPTFGEVEGLPAPQEGVIYIVSGLVAGRCVGRGDVVSPGTGPNDGARRDDKGQIMWVTRLIQAPMA